MVLVDTSVWIRAFYGREPFRAGVARLSQMELIAGHELICGELLMGDRGGRTKLLEAYEVLPWARAVPHREVVALARVRRLQGRGIGWIDVHLLASALLEHFQLWTADTNLAKIADEFRVAYQF